MSMFMNRIFSLALLAAAGMGAAQAGQQAAFHLPFAAQWGGVTLPAGDYKISLPEVGLGNRQFLITGQDVQGYVTPVVTDVTNSTPKPNDHGYLQMVKVDGVFFVSKYESGTTGAVFAFKVPKPKHREELAQREIVKLPASSN